MKMFPASSAIAMCGRESCEFVAGPFSNAACHLLVPAPVAPPAPAMVLRREYERVRFVKPSRPFDRSRAETRKNSIAPDNGALTAAEVLVVKAFFAANH